MFRVSPFPCRARGESGESCWMSSCLKAREIYTQKNRVQLLRYTEDFSLEIWRRTDRTRYGLPAASTTDLMEASPFSKSLPAILSQSMNRPKALKKKLLLPDMLQVTAV